MRHNHHKVKNLILGNSLTLEGINPTLLHEKTFNLANSAQLLEHDCYLLEHYAPYDSLQTVILCLNQNLIYDELEQVPELAVRCSYYQMYMGYPKHPWWSAYNFELARLDVSLAKLKSYKALRRQGKSVACDSLGFAPEYLSQRHNNWRQRKPGPEWSATAHPRQNLRHNLHYLVRMCSFCKAHGINLVLVSMPQWKRPEFPLLVRFRTVGKWMQARYGIQYLDYSSDARFEDDDYIDPWHLNEQGASKLTSILSHDIITPQ